MNKINFISTFESYWISFYVGPGEGIPSPPTHWPPLVKAFDCLIFSEFTFLFYSPISHVDLFLPFQNSMVNIQIFLILIRIITIILYFKLLMFLSFESWTAYQRTFIYIPTNVSFLTTKLRKTQQHFKSSRLTDFLSF